MRALKNAPSHSVVSFSWCGTRSEGLHRHQRESKAFWKRVAAKQERILGKYVMAEAVNDTVEWAPPQKRHSGCNCSSCRMMVDDGPDIDWEGDEYEESWRDPYEIADAIDRAWADEGYEDETCKPSFGFREMEEARLAGPDLTQELIDEREALEEMGFEPIV